MPTVNAADVTSQLPNSGALPRSLLARAIEDSLSVFDFMSEEDANSVRALEYDWARADRITAAINACFAAATPTGNQPPRSVYLPDGGYPISDTLLFGTQNINGGSATPWALFGQGQHAPVLRAKPGMTKTLLQSWSPAGVEFRSFTLDTSLCAAMAWDAEWKQGAGPSTQNVVDRIHVEGGTAPLHVNLRNLNDSYFNMLVVVGTDPSQCGIDMTQPGGLVKISNSIWVNCFLRFGCQNGAIENSVGFGIEFAHGSTNVLKIDGCYLYPNSYAGAVEWSQTLLESPPHNFQSVHAITHVATQFIGNYTPYNSTTEYSLSSFFRLCAYSTVDFHVCQFIANPQVPIDLLSSDSIPDSYSNVLVTIRGGMRSCLLNLNDQPGFDIQARGFMNDFTGKMVSKDISGAFLPTVAGGTTPGTPTYATQAGEWWREGNRLFFNLRVIWSGHTGTGPLLVSNLPFYVKGQNTAVQIGYAGNTFSGATVYALTGNNRSINFFYANGTPVPGAGTEPVPASGDLQISGSYQLDPAA